MSARLLGATAALLLGACAPLRLTNQSPHCQRLYDACLNACPKPPPPNPIAPQYNELQIEVARCTDRCNKDAQSCQ